MIAAMPDATKRYDLEPLKLKLLYNTCYVVDSLIIAWFMRHFVCKSSILK